MKFTEDMLSGLRARLSQRLSEGRFEHTLGVEKAALAISGYFPEIDKSELSAAALLHDVAKELPFEEQKRMALTYGGELSPEVFLSPQVLHAFAAPQCINEDFPEFASPDILSAVFKHTTGDAEMSVFDKIIFISDYVEDGRTYPGCVRLRNKLFAELSPKKNREELIRVLNRACVDEIDETIASLNRRGQTIDSKTKKARSALVSMI